MRCCCILSKFYIKPQHNEALLDPSWVVSYRNSTSNHNSAVDPTAIAQLYLIEILHQTTTEFFDSLILRGCILSKFYIKPQPRPAFWRHERVVSYRNSTSNHNHVDTVRVDYIVVSYRNSTSNHNWKSFIVNSLVVVSYRNSTSNHNRGPRHRRSPPLYLIEILHQTTTVSREGWQNNQLYLIEILHQTTTTEQPMTST